jgi:hypothetical protein
LAVAAAWREFEAFFVAFRRAIDFYVNNAIICLKFQKPIKFQRYCRKFWIVKDLKPFVSGGYGWLIKEEE